MTDSNEVESQNISNSPALLEEQEVPPVYQKPVLRKYDQIEQVKPYGPSELEAG